MVRQRAEIVASHLVLASRSGRRVYGPLSFCAPAGSVVAVCGPSGSGRTSLLLTLTGRLRPTRGTAMVAGLDVVRSSGRVRDLTGLGEFERVNALEPSMTPAAHVAEQRLYRWGALGRDADNVLATVELDAAHVRVRDLDAEQRCRAGIALALVGGKRLVALDDLDRDLSDEQLGRVVALLRELAEERSITVVFSCSHRRTAEAADVVVSLGALYATDVEGDGDYALA